VVEVVEEEKNLAKSPLALKPLLFVDRFVSYLGVTSSIVRLVTWKSPSLITLDTQLEE